MKRVIKLLLVLILFPVLVKATKFNDTVVTANNYNKQFLYPSRYLVESTKFWDLDNNMKPKEASKVNNIFYTQGGLITSKEVEITKK